MSCLCDEHHCPFPLRIVAGLTTLPRALATFPDWRLDVLFAMGQQPELADWRAREPGDFGVMLVEMCAYVLDVTSFYDQLVANESYLATAKLAGAQRRHVSLLGYLPRPAFGSRVSLAAEADGVRLVTLPAGTAIRSGAFDGQPPQIFELGKTLTVEPRVNKLAIDRVRETLLPSPATGLPVTAGSLRARPGELLVLSAGGALMTTHMAGHALMALRIRAPVTYVSFATSLTPPAGATYAGARLLRSGARCGAWKLAPGSGEPAVLSGAQLSLDSRAPLQPGDIVAFEAGGVAAVRRVVSVTEASYTLIQSLQSKITDPDNKVHLLDSPPVQVGVTRITVDSALPFASADVPKLVVLYAMFDAATLHAPLKDTLEQQDPIVVPRLIDPPRTDVTDLALEDVHGEGVVATGVLDAATHTADASDSPAWGRALWAPVQLYGNVAEATRGETVRGEQLGTGDASLPQQTFRLKKKLLTYLAAANAAGRVSSLSIHVGSILWTEVASFYGVGDQQAVYIVRHDDAGETDVTFGGGARLPTGAPVLADYRFGAGAAAPPADSVKQVARPVAGLRRIRNILPAFGGADGEGPAELTYRGPRSALLLGRAISLSDFEIAAVERTGVRTAKAVWSWDKPGLRPAVVVRFIGDPQLVPSVQAALRALAEEDAPITAISAPAQSARLDVDIDADADRVAVDVATAVGQALFAPVTLPGTGGLLRPERLGPDGAVLESVVVRAIMEVAGVAALRALSFDGTPFIETGRTPMPGSYFDFAGGVWVNGQRAG
ncbi:MAG TPA: baseplate J/gp47 family protein [Reyranella sp.]|nr:baseplate J/gp47 family protein [Reyranella sp.]